MQSCQATNPADRPTIPDLLAVVTLLQHSPPIFDLSPPLAMSAGIAMEAAAHKSLNPAWAVADHAPSSSSFNDRDMPPSIASRQSLSDAHCVSDKLVTSSSEPHFTSKVQMTQSLPSNGMRGKTPSIPDTLDYDIMPAEPALLSASRGAAGEQSITLLCLYAKLLPEQVF